MMCDQEVFSILAQCFGKVDETRWNAIIDTRFWGEFIDTICSLMQSSRHLGDQTGLRNSVRKQYPLRTFLSDYEVDALLNPPTYDEKLQFAARHFTGGLPEAALPVESLYERQTRVSFPKEYGSRRKGFYGGAAARYMRDLLGSLGLVLPKAYHACPDHLSLELDLVAVLLRSGMEIQAREFFVERTAWISDYRKRLLSMPDETGFYLALIDVLLGIREQQTEAITTRV